LNQPIIELAIPFAREKRLDLLTAVNELGAVAPDAVDGIGEGDAGGIASVPGIFGKTRLLRGGLGCERRQRWAGHGRTPACSSSSFLAARITWAANSSRPRAFAVLRLMALALVLGRALRIAVLLDRPLGVGRDAGKSQHAHIRGIPDGTEGLD